MERKELNASKASKEISKLLLTSVKCVPSRAVGYLWENYGHTLEYNNLFLKEPQKSSINCWWKTLISAPFSSDKKIKDLK